LAVVAWNMAEKEEASHLIRSSRGDALVLLVTFGLVVFRDLTEGIVVGFALGGLLFIARMSDATEVVDEEPVTEQMGDRVICRLSGPWFFGAAARLGSVLDRIADRPRLFILDLTEVPMMDSSGARSFQMLQRKLARRGAELVIVGAKLGVRSSLAAQGLSAPALRFVDSVSQV
jgi:SulP family sulfate permease